MENKESISKQTLSSVKWNGLEKLGGQGIQFILTLVIARFLTPSDYGIIGILTIFITISQAFIDSGFSSALIRTKNPKVEDFSTVFYFNILIAVVAYALLFVFAPLIADFFSESIVCDVLRVYSVSLIINSFFAVHVAKLQIALDFKSLAKSRIVSVLLSGCIGIFLAYNGFGVWALVAQNLILSVINCIYIYGLTRWVPFSRFSTESFSRLGTFGSRLLAAGLLDVLYKNMSKFAIGKFYTSADLGNYERGSQFASLPNLSINGILNTVTYPIFARIQDDEERLLAVYRKYVQMSSMVIFIISGLLCVLAKPIIIITLTEKWASAIIFMQLFALGCMNDHLNTINLSLLKVRGRSDLFLRLEVFKKTTSILMLIAAIPFGVLAICISAIIYNQVAVIFNTYYTGKLFKYGYLSQVKDFLPYLFKTMVACVPTYLLTFSRLPDLVVLILGCLLSICLYCLLLRKDTNFRYMIDVIIKRTQNT